MLAQDTLRIRSTELRELYLLVGECCELGADPLLWRIHLLERLNQLLGAVSSVMLDASFNPQIPGIGAQVDAAVSPNEYSTQEKEVLSHCLRHMSLEDNPLGPVMLQQSAQSAIVAAARQEWISRRTWEESPFYRAYFDPIGWYDMLIAIVPTASGFQFCNFSRVANDSHFPIRAGRIVQLVLNELAGISEVRLAPLKDNSLLALPTREQQVLLALAEGDEEKQIALRLGISRSTVHEYVRRLLRRYQVNSRSGLLLHSARQIHALNLYDNEDKPRGWFFESKHNNS